MPEIFTGCEPPYTTCRSRVPLCLGDISRAEIERRCSRRPGIPGDVDDYRARIHN